MPVHIISRLSVALFLSALSHPAMAAPVVAPVSGDVRSIVSGSVFDGTSYASFFRLDSVSPNQFTGGNFSVGANEAALLHGQIVAADNTVSATWTRPDQGMAIFNISAFSDPLTNNFGTSVQSYSAVGYTFQTGSNRVVLRGTWSVDGETPGAMEPLNILGFGVFPNLSVSPGSFAIDYAANAEHSVAFDTRIRRSADTAFAFDAQAVGQLTWSFDAVPEPSSWAMLIAGFGLTGAAMRRRRGVIAA